jgi:hypothetical protein
MHYLYLNKHTSHISVILSRFYLQVRKHFFELAPTRRWDPYFKSVTMNIRDENFGNSLMSVMEYIYADNSSGVLLVGTKLVCF